MTILGTCVASGSTLLRLRDTDSSDICDVRDGDDGDGDSESSKQRLVVYPGLLVCLPLLVSAFI